MSKWENNTDLICSNKTEKLVTAEDSFCQIFHLWVTDKFINGNLQIRAEKPTAKKGLSWQAKFRLKSSTGSWGFKIESLPLSAFTFKYVRFSLWSCIDSSAPASICHSLHKNSLGGALSTEPEICHVNYLPALQHNAEFRLEAWVLLLAFKSILQSAQTFETPEGSTTIPLTDALSTSGRRDPKLSEGLLPQPDLPPSNCWVKWMTKAPLTSRFII